jgi:hypothetical protein
MSVFLIADVLLTDDAWVPDYAANVHALVEKHGGKYLSRSANIEILEGEPDAKARQAGSVSRFHMIDDTDGAGAVPYLPAAE